MARKPNSSRQTEALIAALLARPDVWRYGYDLSRETGLKSGTMYPVLMRLQAQGWLEERWEEQAAEGKPRRHLYRLTAQGASEAACLLETARQRALRTRTVAAGTGGRL